MVELVEVGDREAGGCQQLDDRPGEVAAPERPFLQRFEPMLPATHPLVRGEAVFDEVQRASGLENASHLGQGGGTSGIVHSVHVDSAAS